MHRRSAEGRRRATRRSSPRHSRRSGSSRDGAGYRPSAVAARRAIHSRRSGRVGCRGSGLRRTARDRDPPGEHRARRRRPGQRRTARSERDAPPGSTVLDPAAERDRGERDADHQVALEETLGRRRDGYRRGSDEQAGHNDEDEPGERVTLSCRWTMCAQEQPCERARDDRYARGQREQECGLRHRHGRSYGNVEARYGRVTPKRLGANGDDRNSSGT